MQVREKYGVPLFVVHRADLQEVLSEKAKELGVEIRLGTPVSQVHRGFNGRVLLETGEWVEGDVVIAADGVRSEVRGQMLERWGVEVEPVATGDAAYRVLVPVERMRGYEEAERLVEGRVAVRWVGEGRHVSILGR